MRITADTNVIVRVLADDDPRQAEMAKACLRLAERIVYPIAALCEAVWVLRSALKLKPTDIARSIRWLLDDPRAHCDRSLANAGLSLLDAGGDFADAVIAADGRRLGADRLVTFDRRAANLLEQSGEPVLLLDAAPANR